MFFLRFPFPVTLCPLTRTHPGTCPINRFTVYFQPVSHLNQTFLHDRRNLTIRIRSHIQQQVSAITYNINQSQNQCLRRSIIFQILILIISERQSYSPAFFPGLIIRCTWITIFPGVIISMLPSCIICPTVIYHNTVFHRFWIKPCQCSFHLPFFIIDSIRTIRPD